MKKTTITIGIPAYNEEFNIKFLLKSLLQQRVESAQIGEIIVASDGSSDRTVEAAKSVRGKLIKVIGRNSRKGLIYTQNEILRLAKGDILVMLDADVLPQNQYFIEEIIKPILNDKNVGLVGADIVSIKPATLIEKIIAVSHELKWDVYKRLNNADNVYLCHGRARAFSKKFYKELVWPAGYPEDAFSYLFCIEKGFKFAFAPKAKVIFRSPATLSDHIKQSTRFYGGKKKLEIYFSPDVVEREYMIPKLLFGKSLVKYLFKKPLEIIGYFAILFYIRLFMDNYKVQQTKWDISESTKKIVYEK